MEYARSKLPIGCFPLALLNRIREIAVMLREIAIALIVLLAALFITWLVAKAENYVHPPIPRKPEKFDWDRYERMKNKGKPE